MNNLLIHTIIYGINPESYIFRSSYQSHQVPLPLTSSTQCNDMPEYSNLPQPRQQASIASAAAAVAQQAASNSSTSFNSKRSRHSSLWSLQDEQELLEQQQGDHSNTGDMVNYVNDPFTGHSSEFSASSAGIQMMRQQLNDEMESQMRSSFQNSSSNSKARHSNAASAASNEALN